MTKPKKKQTTIDDTLVEEPLALAGPPEHFAVSIIPKLKNNRVIFDVVKFYFTEDGLCGDREVLHSSINEHTAMTLLFQTAHETFSLKEMRKKIKHLKGGK